MQIFSDTLAIQNLTDIKFGITRSNKHLPDSRLLSWLLATVDRRWTSFSNLNPRDANEAIACKEY